MVKTFETMQNIINTKLLSVQKMAKVLANLFANNDKCDDKDMSALKKIKKTLLVAKKNYDMGACPIISSYYKNKNESGSDPKYLKEFTSMINGKNLPRSMYILFTKLETMYDLFVENYTNRPSNGL